MEIRSLFFLVVDALVGILSIFGVAAGEYIYSTCTDRPLYGGNKTIRLLINCVCVACMAYMLAPSIDKIVAKLLSPYIPEPVAAKVAALHAAWTILVVNYRENDGVMRQLVVNDVAQLAPDAPVLSGDQREEFEQAQDFVKGWQQNTRDGWEAILAKHPSDDLTPLAEYERNKIPLPAPIIQFPQGWTRTASSVNAEVIVLSDQAFNFAKKGDCKSSEDTIAEIGKEIIKYKIHIELDKRHSAAEMQVQNHVFAALHEQALCDSINSALDAGAMK